MRPKLARPTQAPEAEEATTGTVYVAPGVGGVVKFTTRWPPRLMQPVTVMAEPCRGLLGSKESVSSDDAGSVRSPALYERRRRGTATTKNGEEKPEKAD